MIYEDTPRPNCKNVNHLYDLDLSPIDLEMVHDTLSPLGLYLGHM